MTSPLTGARDGLATLDQKLQQKVALQSELGWPQEPKRPVLCLSAGMTDALGGQLLSDVLPGILTLQVELLVLGKGSATYGSLFTKLAKEHGHRVHIVSDTDDAVRTMLTASDMALFLSADHPRADVERCLRYGTVPVAPSMTPLDDYNAVQETGNAFLYDIPTQWGCFAALVRATETFKFPYDWKTIQKHCLETVRAKN